MAFEPGLASVAVQRGWEALRASGWSIQRLRPRHVRGAPPQEQEAFSRPCLPCSPGKPAPARNAHIVLPVLDNAGHTEPDLALPEGIRLDATMPSSAEGLLSFRSELALESIHWKYGK
jgi:hypothetical protein